MKKSDKLQSLLFIVYIAAMFVLFIATPDREFSELENRMLEQVPSFSAEALSSKKFTFAFEGYTTDQFPFRDFWIPLKARIEILSGKHENNGIYLGRDGALYERFSTPDASRIEYNVEIVNALTDSVTIPVYFALIPSSAEIFSDMLPDNAPCDSQAEVIDTIYAGLDATTIDVFGALRGHSDEYIFYRTDHHWTSLGAYYAYTALTDAMDIEPETDFDRRVVSDSFYGAVYSSSAITWVEPDSVEIFREPSEGVTVSKLSRGSFIDSPVYAFEFLEKKDKYSMFMGGNTGLLQIHTENADSPSLLILRDSFTDSLIPFLLPHFSELHVLDLRYYPMNLKLSDYIAEHNPDMMLICYGLHNFGVDNFIFRMAE